MRSLTKTPIAVKPPDNASRYRLWGSASSWASVVLIPNRVNPAQPLAAEILLSIYHGSRQGETLAECGVPIHVVQKTVGHASLKMISERYVHVTPEVVAASSEPYFEALATGAVAQ